MKIREISENEFLNMPDKDIRQFGNFSFLRTFGSKYQNYFKSKNSIANLDSFQEMDGEKFSDIKVGMPESDPAKFLIDMLYNPALEELKYSLLSQDKKSEEIRASYKRTILPEKIYSRNDDGDRFLKHPALDVFVSFGDSKQTDSVFTICSYWPVYPPSDDSAVNVQDFFNNYDVMFDGEITWINDDSPYKEKIREMGDCSEFIMNLFITYVQIQFLLKNKPTIFKVASEHPVRTYGKSSGTNNKRNHAKIVRTICINKEELEKQQRGHHEITCPCWGVVGHWRTYKKTGKRVWVAPYRKGKQRNNPDAYHPKDYEFVGGES